MGAEHAGRYGNLYYHDSAGKMGFVNAGQIDSNGNVRNSAKTGDNNVIYVWVLLCLAAMGTMVYVSGKRRV